MKHKDSLEGLQLPLLPLFHTVLLPGGFVRVLIPDSWRKSGSLVQHLLQQSGGEVYVAAVPYSLSKPGDEDEVVEEHLDLDKLHHTGTAARVLQLVKRTESGGWTVMLEGRCRVRVCDVSPSHLQEMFVASVEQLDYLGGPSPGAPSHRVGQQSQKGGAAPHGSKRSHGQVGEAESKRQEELVQELLQGTRQLFMLLQGGADGRESGRRVTKMLQSQSPAKVADILGALVSRGSKDRLAVLSTLDVTKRLELVEEAMTKLLAAAAKAAGGGGERGLGGATGGLVPTGTGVARRAGLQRPLRLSSLGGDPRGMPGEDEDEDGKEELKALMEKLQASNPPPEVLRVAVREYKRLSRSSEQHPGYAMSLAYLEALAELPWNRWSHQVPCQQQQEQHWRGREEDTGAQRAEHAGQGHGAEEEAALVAGPEGVGGGEELSLGEVRRRLDDAHYGLDKIKDRIVQYVAVQRLRGWDARAPILCFIGPPGVGKTSLARCVGDVLGRPFQRISLGGVRDEAEIRGHRRTYIGAMPGRVIQAVRRAAVRDPVLLLDEVDKMGRDARGDPAAALLEVLDPEQNHAFVDTYLGVPFNLSSVVFVSTANRAADIPPPLLDRLEVVQLAGYTLEEKMHIAERHLVPRVLSEHGLLPGQLLFPEAALKLLVDGYTREAGVRTLARCLAAICRHAAVQVVVERERAGGAGGRGARAPGSDGETVEGGGVGGGSIDVEPNTPTWGAPFTGSNPAAGAGPAVAAAAAGGTFPLHGLSRGLTSQRGAPAGAAAASAASPPLPDPFPTHSLAPPDTLVLWALLASLAAAMPPQQATSQRGTDAAGVSPPGVPRSAQGQAPSLGGYPWVHLVASRGGGLSPGGSPKAQHGAGGWFSWLPWGRHLAAQHAEQGAGGAAQQGWEAAQLGGLGEDGLQSMSLAGSMHSMPPQHDAAGTAAAPAGSLGGGGGWTGVVGGGERLARQAQHAQQEGVAGVGGPSGGLLGGQVDPPRPVVVDEALIEEVLGPVRYTGHDNSERVASPGSAAGLVWTAVGGQVQYIECLAVGEGRGKGPGSLTLTGQLGDVLEESARIALSWVRAHAAALGLPPGHSCPATSWDVHIHLPAGGVPKDGPSAGVTLASALVSLFTGRRVRADTAMTGELTLRGLVLPVGGIKEKLLAAHTAGMSRVVVPARNLRDVQADVPPQIRQALEIVGAEKLEDVLRAVLDPPIDLHPALQAKL